MVELLSITVLFRLSSCLEDLGRIAAERYPFAWPKVFGQRGLIRADR